MSADPWQTVETARAERQRAAAELNRARLVHAALAALRDAVEREAATESDVAAVQDALARFGGEGRTEALAYLREGVVDGERTAVPAFRQGRAVGGDVDAVATALAAYASDGTWDPVPEAVGRVVDGAPTGEADATACGHLVDLFALVVEGCVAYREARAEAATDALGSAHADGDPLERLGEQPVALLPVRLETRFVDQDGDPRGPPTDLLVRVYPDQIHADAHEDELTAEEVTWGRNFWATVWYARHPDPDAVALGDPTSQYLTERLPTERLRRLVADVDPDAFSTEHAARYDELKARAWNQLLERFGRERAAYLVHALRPAEGAEALLTRPPEPPEPEDDGEEEPSGGGLVLEEIPHLDPAGLDLPEHVAVGDIQGALSGVPLDPGTSQGDLQTAVDKAVFDDGFDPTVFDPERLSFDPETIGPAFEPLPTKVPGFEFPEVPRRPESWTKAPTAELLPDRWVVVAEWDDERTNEESIQRVAVAGDAVDEELAMAPSPESVAADAVETEGPAPPETEWLVEFDAAKAAGMGVELDLGRLTDRGFDLASGFTRVTAVGVKASMDADDAPAALRDLLDAHQYTDGLSFLTQGTATNAADGEGYTASIPPEESVGVAAGETLVESGDRSDGDLLARALAIDPGEDERHVFAHVEGADGTEQRDARHMNSALWPSTLGYYLTHLLVDADLASGASGNGQSAGPAFDDLHQPLLWLDAYRRHFVRYVRGRGPFPTLRVGRQPYGVLPVSAVETDIDVSIVEQDVIDGIEAGDLNLGDAVDRGYDVPTLVDAGVRPGPLLDAGAPPRDLLGSGVSPRILTAAGVPAQEVVNAGATPDAFLRDGVPLTDRTALTDERLEAAGISPAALSAFGIAPADLASGRVTADQLDDLGIGTRALAEAVLPQELRDAGVTPERLDRADVDPAALLDGDLTADELRQAGLSTESLAEALLPRDLREAGLSPEKIGEALDLESLLAGDVSLDDLTDAGLDPQTLADAGLLPDAFGDAADAVEDLLSAGLDPMALVRGDLTPQTLSDAGLDPTLLAAAGVAPKRLVDAGMDMVSVASKATGPVGDLLEAGAKPSELARAGVTVAQLAGVDVPADELLKAGFAADKLVGSGFDVSGIVESGARPSDLKKGGVDAGTLRSAGQSAGALRVGGYTAEELVEAGFTAEELLNGGFDADAVAAAGLDPEAVDAGRSVAELLAEGFGPERLREEGYAPDALREAGVDTERLVAAGYTVGELVDAGLDPEALLESGLAVEALRGAGVDARTLSEAGVAAERLRDAGATAEDLLASGEAPERLLEAGFTATELDVAGVDVDGLAEDVVSGEADAGDVAGAAVEGLTYAASVLRDPDQAERDAYSFSFDPAIPKLTGAPKRGRKRGGKDDDATADGGVAPVQLNLPQSIDDQLAGNLSTYLTGFRPFWESAAADLPMADGLQTDELAATLRREGRSSGIRHQTHVYSGEHARGDDWVPQAVRRYFLDDQRTAVASILDQADLDALDPRLANLYHTDIASDEARERMGQGDNTLRAAFYDHLMRRDPEPVDRTDLVAGDLDAFVDALLDCTVDQTVDLAQPVNPFRMPVDPTALDVEGYEDMGWDARLRTLVSGLESADDPLSYANRVLSGPKPDDHDPDETARFRLLARLQAEHGDPGVVRSLLRVLLQHGLVHAYLNGRLRLGQAYGDPPQTGPEPHSYADGERGLLWELDQPVPDALAAHPNVEQGDSYETALATAAADYTATTSIDPRVSEFTDSLQYLGDREPAALADLLLETLDLCSHRLDAWWTSLATKRLFELREAQGSYDPDGDGHQAWTAGDEDAPRVTVDPGLLGAVQNAAGGPLTLPDATPADEEATDGGESKDEDTTEDEPLDTSVDLSAGPRLDPEATLDTDPNLDASDLAGQGGRDWPQFEGGDDEPTGTIDLSGINEGVANNPGLSEDALDVGQVQADPGLYVGGYGYVEDLRPDPQTETPSYVHAPSEQHATTAAILRSGYEAHDGDGPNPLATDLSAGRVRQGLRLIRGVRRGQSLGELLGYRFERRLHEETLDIDEEGDAPDAAVNLMQYAATFRAAFPAVRDTVERAEGPDADDADLKARDVVDGHALARNWGDYPFGEADELPAAGSEAKARLDGIVEELDAALDAAGDLLTAESVHQLGQGNFDRAGASVAALARGDPLPDPEVVSTPRTETGVTHRLLSVLGTETATEGDTPRDAAEPALAAWAADRLPDPDDVECLATLRWTEAGETSVERTHETTVRLSALGLGALDVLAVCGGDGEAARTALESQLAYHVVRSRPPVAPADATVELELQGTERDAAVSVADLLELAGALRDAVTEARPATAADLAHPGERAGDGYDEATVQTLTARAETAHAALFGVADSLDERLSVLDPAHGRGDGLMGVTDPETGATPYGEPGEVGAEDTGQSLLPGRGTARAGVAEADPEAFTEPTLTDRVAAVSDATETVAADVPLDTVLTEAAALDPERLATDLGALADALPAGPLTPDADQRLGGTSQETVHGVLGRVPEPPADDGTETDEPPATPEDWGAVTADVTVWGVGGATWFEHSESVTPQGDGRFAVDIDCSGVPPGTRLRVVATVAGTVQYSATARVVPESEPPSPTETLDADCPELARLRWLAAQPALRADGPLGTLRGALAETAWAAVREERDAIDTAASAVSEAQQTAVHALADLGDADVDGVVDPAAALAGTVGDLGLDRLFNVEPGAADAASATYYYASPSNPGAARARLRHAADNPTALLDGLGAPYRQYAPAAARALDAAATPHDAPAHLGALLEGEGWLVPALGAELDAPAALLRDLAAWLQSPADLPNGAAGTLPERLRDLADAAEDVTGLQNALQSAGVEEPTPAAFASVCRAVADAMGSQSVPDAASQRTAFAGQVDGDAADLETGAGLLEDLVTPATAGEPIDESFRQAVLERVRAPLRTAADYGLFGATPQSPDGATPDDERGLVEQAGATLTQVRKRLGDAQALVPAALPDRPLPQRVEDASDRLRALFGDAFVVVPPFAPTNGPEAAATFTDEAMLDGRPSAPESWLQRAAAVRPHQATFQQARSYAEALSGGLTPSLRAGQLPHTPGTTWAALTDEHPDPGTVSLVAQFDGCGPADLDGGRVAGLLVDEWSEAVPQDEETTGIALQYDDPGNRAQQSVLVATPPDGGEWTLGDLYSAVVETSEYTKLRAVDMGDLPALSALLPGAYLPHHQGDPPRTSTTDLSNLDIYDQRFVLAPPQLSFQGVFLGGDGE